MASRETGLALDENFDFIIDSSGDLKSVDQIEELQKDLSGAVTAIIRDQFLGVKPNENIIAELESVITSRVEFDARVLSVRTISVGMSQGETQYNVYLALDTIYGDTEVNV